MIDFIFKYWELSCLACTIFIVIIHKKREGASKRYDVVADTDRDGMVKRVKKSMENQTGEMADVKKRRVGATVENDSFFADITVKPKKK